MQKTIIVPIDTLLNYTVHIPSNIKMGDTLLMKFMIFESGVPLSLSGQTANIELLKSDGKEIDKTADNIIGNVITKLFDKQATSCSGKVRGEICFSDSNGTTITNDFVFNVKNSYCNEAVIKSEDDIETLEDMRAIIRNFEDEISVIGTSAEAVSALNSIKKYIDDNLPQLINQNSKAESNISELKTENTRAETNIKNLKKENDNAEDKLDKFRLYDTTNLIQQVQDNTSQLNDITQGRFGKKKYVAVGDSIVYGFVDNPYCKLVAEAMDMDYVNMGISGSTITYKNDEEVSSVYARRAEIPEDADLISIHAGTNDYGHDSIMGDSRYTESDSGFYGFYGAYYKLINWILENRPNAQLFIITPTHRENEIVENSEGYILEDYVNVERDVAEHFGVPVLDFFGDSAFNLAISSQKSIYSNDGLHPTQNGHELMANKIVNFIRRL